MRVHVPEFSTNLLQTLLLHITSPSLYTFIDTTIPHPPSSMPLHISCTPLPPATPSLSSRATLTLRLPSLHRINRAWNHSPPVHRINRALLQTYINERAWHPSCSSSCGRRTRARRRRPRSPSSPCRRPSTAPPTRQHHSSRMGRTGSPPVCGRTHLDDPRAW